MLIRKETVSSAVADMFKRVAGNRIRRIGVVVGEVGGQIGMRDFPYPSLLRTIMLSIASSPR
jgi:hypothetical protein